MENLIENVKVFVNNSEVSSETKEVVNRAIKYGFNCVYTQVNNRLPGENLTKHVENIFNNVLCDIENIPGRIWNGKVLLYGEYVSPTKFLNTYTTEYIDYVQSFR